MTKWKRPKGGIGKPSSSSAHQYWQKARGNKSTHVGDIKEGGVDLIALIVEESLNNETGLSSQLVSALVLPLERPPDGEDNERADGPASDDNAPGDVVPRRELLLPQLGRAEVTDAVSDEVHHVRGRLLGVAGTGQGVPREHDDEGWGRETGEVQTGEDAALVRPRQADDKQTSCDTVYELVPGTSLMPHSHRDGETGRCEGAALSVLDDHNDDPDVDDLNDTGNTAEKEGLLGVEAQGLDDRTRLVHEGVAEVVEEGVDGELSSASLFWHTQWSLRVDLQPRLSIR